MNNKEIKSINPNPPADFHPDRQPFTPLTPFRYWCQKVLPLVYDDSLSYYELLCKVVDYLNKTMEDVDNFNTDMASLYDTYEQLQEYVNNYFSSLDVQTEINNKLDSMASDGTLSKLIQPLFDEYKEEIDSEIADFKETTNEQNSKISVLESRMNEFTKLSDGSTSGDAELVDIRIGYDGETYPTAGDAVRGQVKSTNIFSRISPEIETSVYNNGKVSFNEDKTILTITNSLGDTFRGGGFQFYKALTKGTITITFESEKTLKSKNNLIMVNEKDINGDNLVAYSKTGTKYKIILTPDYTVGLSSLVKVWFNTNISDTITIYNLSVKFMEGDSQYFNENFDEAYLMAKQSITKLDAPYGSFKNAVIPRENKLYQIIDKWIITYDYTGGNSIVLDVESTKAKEIVISGYSWEPQYRYFLYAFTDEYGTVIFAKNDVSHENVKDLKIEVPKNAKFLYINGRMDMQPASVSYTGYLFNVYAIIPTKTSQLENDSRFITIDDIPVNNPLKGKKVITLGDSITALGTGERGWVKYFLEKTEMTLVANTAVNSAVLKDYSNTTYDGNPSQSVQDNNVLGNQVQKILNNDYEAPDLIMIAIGTNGGIAISDTDILNAYYDSGNDLIPLTSVNRRTDAGAYRYCLETLHNKYPNALIVWCTPIMGYQKIRSAQNAVKYSESLRIATGFSGQIMCDTLRCGINGVNEQNGANGEYLIDGLHPNKNGAMKIGYFNATFIILHAQMIL